MFSKPNVSKLKVGYGLWLVEKVKSAYEPTVAHRAGAYPNFCSMKRLEVKLLSPG